MIVYGDQTWRTTVGGVARALARRFASGGPHVSLDEARVRLVLAGTLEQAMADRAAEAGDGAAVGATMAAALTRALADIFLAEHDSPHNAPPQSWAASEALLAVIAARDDATAVDVRTPEGFAWYALLPDAYIASTRRWHRRHPGCRRTAVVGLRSIGTTLAAVAAATLERAGVPAASATVRPGGHPFARTCRLPPSIVGLASNADRVLVVDEGPGLSGSSMVAVAEALVAAGFPRERIDFLAGHGNGPGPAASEHIRAWWRPERVWSTDPLAATVGGTSLATVLTEAAGRLLDEPVGRLSDAGGGAWRADAPIPDDAAAVIAGPLERPKLIARGRSGRRVLLRWAGLALRHPSASRADRIVTVGEAEQVQRQRLAARGIGVPVALATHGWLAEPWLAGRRLGLGDLDAAQIERLAGAIACAAGPPLAPTEATAGIERLAHMLASNAATVLGADAAHAADRASATEAARLAAGERWWPRYGDGRLAPWEWVLGADGRVTKADGGGHDQDHSIVGPQPIAWDVAGAIVEWRMGPREAGLLVARVAAIAGLSPAPDATCLAWWRAAYAAYRLGVASLGAAQCGTAHDASQAGVDGRQTGLAGPAATFHRAALARALARLAP